MYLFITSHTENSKLFVTIFSHALQNIWTTWNTIASILREHILAYLSLSIVCSSKLTFFLIINLFRSLNFARKCLRKRTWIWMKNICSSLLTINLSEKLKKKSISYFQFPISLSHSPFPIHHFSFSICHILILVYFRHTKLMFFLFSLVEHNQCCDMPQHHVTKRW